MSSGSLVRSWRETSSTIAPTIAKASSGRGEAVDLAGLGVGAVGLVDVVGDARQRGVAALGRARAGADDLDQQRLRLVGEGVDDLEERAHGGADPALRASRPPWSRAACAMPSTTTSMAASKSARMHSSLLPKCS